jgi:hypothetical protein
VYGFGSAYTSWELGAQVSVYGFGSAYTSWELGAQVSVYGFGSAYTSWELGAQVSVYGFGSAYTSWELRRRQRGPAGGVPVQRSAAAAWDSAACEAQEDRYVRTTCKPLQVNSITHVQVPCTN